MDLFSGRGFFRFYLAGQNLKWFWGLIQVYSVVLSFVSVLQTSVQFNEWEKRRHTLHRYLRRKLKSHVKVIIVDTTLQPIMNANFGPHRF